MNRDELRVGGAAALIGGSVGFAVNLLHPTPPADPEALLRLVAASPHWPQLHFMGMLAVVFMISGLAMLSRNLAGGTALAIGALGRYIIILSGAVFIVMTMIDGFASKAVADRLVAAEPGQQQVLLPAARAIIHVERALFPVFAGVFLGVSFIVLGAAVWRSENFPRWLGLWGMLGGVMCATVGFGFAFRTAFLLPVWLIGVAAVISWTLVMGVMMLRAARSVTA